MDEKQSFEANTNQQTSGERSVPAPRTDTRFCPNCGAENAADANFCNTCGASLTGTLPSTEQNLPPETGDTYESRYTGNAIVRLLILLGVGIGSVCTLFIAYPFLTCLYEKWIKSHTFVNGRQLEFDGNGAQLIGKFMWWLFLSVITIGIYAFFRLPLNMQRWRAKHTHVKGYRPDGKKGESKFTGGILGLWGVRFLRGITFGLGFISLGLISAWGKLVKLRWFNEKKVIDGVRIHNDSKLGQFWVKRFIWNILMICTVFIHTIFIKPNSQKKFLAKHDKFANPSVFPRPECTIDEVIAREQEAKTKNTNYSRYVKYFSIPVIVYAAIALICSIIIAFTLPEQRMISIYISLPEIILMTPCSFTYKQAKVHKESNLIKVKKFYYISAVAAAVCVIIAAFLPILLQLRSL